MVAEPTSLAVTTPLLTVATEASEELQVTVLSVALSGLTVAVKVTVSPAFNEALVLFSVTLVTGVASTVIKQVAVLSPALAVMVALPTFFAVTTPLLTVATEASDVVQVTVLSMASSGLTVGVKVTVSPTFSDALVLFRLTEVTGVSKTVTKQLAVLSFTFTVIVALPTPTAVTTTLVPSEATLNSATRALSDLHDTPSIVASSGLTVYVKVTVSPTFSDALVLFRLTEVTGVATTVIVQVADFSPAFAVMVAEPTSLAVTTPLLTVATEASEELQVTVLSVALSGLTVAVKVTVSPAFNEALVLFSVTLVTGVASTVIKQVAVLSPALAVMVALPTFFAVTTPLLTVATEASDVVQVTVLSVASSGLTVGVKVTVSPTFSDALVLFRLTEVTGVATTVIVQVADFSPAFAVMVAEPTSLAVTTPLLTVATEASEVLQVTVLSVASSGFTVAVRVTVSSTFISKSFLFRDISVTGTTLALTVTAHIAVFPPSSVFTLIVALPGATATTVPSETVAISSLLLDHNTVLL